MAKKTGTGKETENAKAKAKAKNVFDVQRSRAETLAGFLRLADHVMTDKSGIKSLFLSCSQYYCDEAADAVHDSIATSKNLIPDATAGGDDDDEDGDGDGGGDGAAPLSFSSRWKYMSWDDNGTAVYGFAPFCEEEGDNEGGTSSPLVLAQRIGDAVRATWLGDLHRPWLDFHGAMKDRDGEDSMFDGEDGLEFAQDPPPATLESAQEKELYAQVLATPADLSVREVLRDVWNQRDDPRGEHAAITSAKKRTPEMVRRAADLVLEHGRSWLGPLGSVIPLSGALFDRGPFVRAATVYAANAKAFAKVASAPEWATIEELSFANQSTRVVSSAMKNLRAVGPLNANELKPLLTGTWRIEDLEYEGTQLAPLLALKLPLRCLRLRTTPKAAAEIKSLAKTPYWSKLERLELWLPDGSSAEDDAAVVTQAFKSASGSIGSTCQLAVGVRSNNRRSGWMLTGNAKERRLELHLPDGRFEQGAAFAKAFGLKLTSWEPSSRASDFVHFALGVSDETGKRKNKKRASK